MDAYLFHEKPILCNNRRCMVSANKYFKKIWINKNGREIGGFYKCQACGVLYIHLRAYQSKTMNGEVVLLNPEDEQTIIREYILKRRKIKEEKEVEQRNRSEIEFDRLYREERKKMEEGLRYYNYDKEGFLLIAGKSDME